MSKPAANIESLLAARRPTPPDRLRQQVMDTIQQATLKQTRRDDRRVILTGLISLLLIAMVFAVVLIYQHSLIVKSIVSLGYIFNLFPWMTEICHG